MTELDRLLAEAEINRLIIRYAALNDSGDFTGLVATFVDDGVFVRPMTSDAVVGRAAILASFLARPPRIARHMTSNVTVDFVGDDAATARSMMLLYTAAAGALPAVATPGAKLGGFDDRLVRTPEGWRFAERRGWVDLTIEGQ